MKKTVKSYLVMEKVDFTQKINDQIALGNALLQKQITTDEALGNFRSEVSKWSDYNEELLKQSFDNPDNEYKQEYKNSYLPLGSLGTHTFSDKVHAQERIISSYLRGLEKIANKINLIPVAGGI
jgi:hypothetical protein